MVKRKVIYWHRLGIKVFEVDEGNLNLLREIESIDLVEIQEHLDFLKGSEVYLLLSDAISYLFKSEIDSSEVVDSGFRERLLKIIKADIPEDFSNFSWDYKLVENEGKKSVLIFAPIAEVQTKINEISKNLEIKFVVIEPESISAERDPNPIIGITKKSDMLGKDEEVLNIVVDEQPNKSNKKGILILLFIVITLILIIFFFSKIIVFPLSGVFNKKSEITPTLVPTIAIPTIAVLQKWEDLSITILNGTKIAGKAGKVADKLKISGVINITSGNADNANYADSKLIFKNEEIKKIALEKILMVVSVINSNQLVDNTIDSDVKLILGSN
jgi:hypothetical protein